MDNLPPPTPLSTGLGTPPQNPRSGETSSLGGGEDPRTVANAQTTENGEGMDLEELIMFPPTNIEKGNEEAISSTNTR